MTESNENTNKQTVLLGEKTLDKAIADVTRTLNNHQALYEAAKAGSKKEAAMESIRECLIELFEAADMDLTLAVLNVLVRAFNMIQMAERYDGSIGINSRNAPSVIAAIRAFADITVDSITSVVEDPKKLLKYAQDIQDDIWQSTQAHTVNIDLLKENGGEDDE